MVERSVVINWLILLVIATLLCAFQTTFWFQIVGGSVAPQLWLNLVIYVILFRKPFEGLILIYFFAILMRQWTAMPLGVMWLSFLILHMILVFLKSRVFWPGTRYFVLASIVGVCVYNLINVILSRTLDNNPVTFQFLRFVMEMILTPIWAAPIYWLMTAIDEWTLKDASAEGAES